jgi:hypothetical protein
MNCFFLKFEKKWQYHQRGKWKELKKNDFEIYYERKMKKLKYATKILKRTNHIFHLCHRDKISNNTPIPLMYTTVYHKLVLVVFN